MAISCSRMTSSLRLICVAAAALAILSSPPAAHARRTVAQKKKIALGEYERAQQLRDSLAGKPESKRTSKDYDKVINAFRRVYYTAPTSAKADDSVQAVAELLSEQGRLFDDDKAFANAIGQYEFLRREYPGSHNRFGALFTIAQIYYEDLGDNDKAKETFEEFLKRYPGNRLAEQARQALKDIAADEQEQKSASSAKNKKTASKKKPKKEAEVAKDEPQPESAAPAEEKPADHRERESRGRTLVTGIRYWSTPDYTRVAIDLEEEVKYEAGRVPAPDRIFFDLHNTKLASELVGKTFEVGDGFLRKIRVAQFNLNLTRVVLEVDDVAEYSAFLLPNPYRLIIDVHGKQQRTSQTAQAEPGSPPPARPKAPEAKPAVIAKAPEPKPALTSAKADAATEKALDEAESASTPDATKELTQPAALADKELKSKEQKATAKPTSEPTVAVVTPRKGKSGDTSVEEDDSKPPIVAKVHEATPTSSGDRSLIRALGLKIGRIVVDAGHGGHDTGTIGPNGLLEKDLVLDVALRLGKLLENKLGAEVVYTRDDDTFIPLETRTAIANKHQADLFISVHANSSKDASARGVETYYLNFTSNAEALEVAARENAVSEKSVFELQDLVKKIALKEKIEESREFAANVQQSLYSGLSNRNPGLKNRGVKKAPFVVLIGANMPSILAEISFVSNPSDAKKLKTPEYRQRIAESLFKGVSKYANGLSGVKVASREETASGGN
jgi:N-acetylmuramoyl-L-alanine amidase